MAKYNYIDELNKAQQRLDVGDIEMVFDRLFSQIRAVHFTYENMDENNSQYVYDPAAVLGHNIHEMRETLRQMDRKIFNGNLGLTKDDEDRISVRP